MEQIRNVNLPINMILVDHRIRLIFSSQEVNVNNIIRSLNKEMKSHAKNGV
jgi:hypothetical protein